MHRTRRQSSDKSHDASSFLVRRRSSRIFRRNKTTDALMLGKDRNDSNFRRDHPSRRAAKYKLSEVLSNPVTSALFNNFLQQEFSGENMEFWERVNVFRAQKRKSKKFAKTIYNQFVADGSPKQINVSMTTRNKIKDDLKRCPDSLFDVAYEEIYKLMENDSYVRFRRSPYYWRCCCILNFDK
uniref:regulator of G-protein signaling 21-like n=1 Tax=Ciona intestinalis TaxID=7719 RepID=UPI000EF44CF3|nr:regulator of G-protein signaling 21-like [Ciona intestinalis]|eukprot:XP_026691820.1 regulator of G-protein signaling 21-like [Ciona intestinalis]